MNDEEFMDLREITIKLGDARDFMMLSTALYTASKILMGAEEQTLLAEVLEQIRVQLFERGE